MNRSSRIGALLLGTASLIGAIAVTATPAAAAIDDTGAVQTFTHPSMNHPLGVTTLNTHLWFTNYVTGAIGRVSVSGGHTVDIWSPPLIVEPQGISTAADGTLWVASSGNDRLVRLTPGAGAPGVTTYIDPAGEVQHPIDTVEGPDGHIWFTSRDSGSIGEFTRSPQGFDTYSHPDLVAPESIAVGPDGNLWFTDPEADLVGRITTAGVITVYPHADIHGPLDIVAGADGRMWFTIYQGTPAVGAIRPSTGAITVYTDPLGDLGAPSRIAADTDGTLWVTNEPDQATRVTTRGAMATFEVTDGDVGGIAVNLTDGHPWMVDPSANEIHRLDSGYFSPHGYTDVPATARYDRALRWAAWHDIAVDAPTFQPDRPIRRGPIARMLWRVRKIVGGYPDHGFSDVPAGAGYEAALDWAAFYGIVQAVTGDEYRPNQPVTRIQAVGMLWRMVGSPTGLPEHGFSDVGAGNAAVRWAQARGIAKAFPNGTFRPHGPVSRSSIVTMLFNLALNPAAWTATFPAPTVLFE